MIGFIFLLRRFRTSLMMVLDVGAWVLAYSVFAWLRYDSVVQSVPWVATIVAALLTGAVYLALGWTTGLLRGRSSVASLEEMVLLGTVVLATGLTASVVNAIVQVLPRSVPPAAAIATLVLTAWARAAWRRLKERTYEGTGRGLGSRVLVVGAGEAGRELIASMLRDPQHRWQPVGILDDDTAKRRLRIRSIPVLGPTSSLAEVAASVEVEAVVIAIPSADAAMINRLRLAAMDAGLPVKVLPATTELLSDHVGIRDIRDVDITDVLGRNQVDTDITAIAGYLTGRRVLVTGAGGSIGSELCRQIHRFAPSELMMLDRDESALHGVELSIHGKALLDSDEVILCDLRDEKAVNAVFDRRRPEVVFHAAALKHLPMLEQYPSEAVKTNVLGTRIVLDAARRSGVSTFVNISTDKAADPCSVLGYSKRIAEALTAGRARVASGTFVSVRFGNVLGSRGSVLTAFAKQIADGGPLTVTDPDVTRYFMTIAEACQLVIQAAAIGSDGEVMVLDMGEPIRIIDVARQLMEQAGVRHRIEFTGLRAGEKMHEDLFGAGEPQNVRPHHELVSHVPVPAIGDAEVDALPVEGSTATVREAMRMLCEEVDASVSAVPAALSLTSSGHATNGNLRLT